MRDPKLEREYMKEEIEYFSGLTGCFCTSAAIVAGLIIGAVLCIIL